MNQVRDALLGVAVADALGVPVEFQSRNQLKRKPVVDMREYGTYHQPRGTWSDDSSMTFCLAESLLKGYDLQDIALKFIQWKMQAKWTPHGEVFDIGNTTSDAISKLINLLAAKDTGHLKLLRYESHEFTNGNGALMRILPLYFYIKDKAIADQFEVIWEQSALTHGHIRSALACLMYIRMADHLAKRQSIRDAYDTSRQEMKAFFETQSIAEREQLMFARLIDEDISLVEEDEIRSSGYVLHSLEAALWCLLRENDYASTVLAAVNLGEDTDTTAAIAGGLAGLHYGIDAIPAQWKKDLIRLDDILQLCDQLYEKYGDRQTD